MKEQIEEIAKVLYDSDNKPSVLICGIEEVATDLYNAGYRRQIEAEWVAKKEMYRTPSAKNYYCSNCAKSAIFDSFMGVSRITKYCPDCGAKMKGE